MLTATNIIKSIGNGPNQVNILCGVSLDVREGEIVAIIGPSGCGKSTLLGILSGLDAPTAGCVHIDGQDIYALSKRALDRFRNLHIGVIFQSHNLINELNCIDNISIPWVFADSKARAAQNGRMQELLSLIGLESKGKLYPHQLSGGEQQRIAVARALLMHPQILFADEPTGALDRENSRMLLRIFRDSVAKVGHAIVLVTHDPEVAGQCDRVITMLDGFFTEGRQ